MTKIKNDSLPRKEQNSRWVRVKKTIRRKVEKMEEETCEQTVKEGESIGRV
jgi:hypothetical protein